MVEIVKNMANRLDVRKTGNSVPQDAKPIKSKTRNFIVVFSQLKKAFGSKNSARNNAQEPDQDSIVASCDVFSTNEERPG